MMKRWTLFLSALLCLGLLGGCQTTPSQESHPSGSVSAASRAESLEQSRRESAAASQNPALPISEGENALARYPGLTFEQLSEGDEASRIRTAVMNNGGRYVQYGGAIYYRRYSAEGFAASGLWGDFAPVPAAQSQMMRLNPDGSQDVLFEDDGYGPIFIYQNASVAAGAQFILSRWVEDELGLSYTETYTVDFSDYTVGASRLGEPFAVDEERSLLLMRTAGSGLFALDMTNQETNWLAGTHYQPLYYDADEGRLYASIASDDPAERNRITIAAIDPSTAEEVILFSDVRGDAKQQVVDDSYIDPFYTFYSAGTDEERFYANIVQREGSDLYEQEPVRLEVKKDGSAYAYRQAFTEAEWFGAFRPFSYRADSPFHKDLDGYYMYDSADAEQARLVLSQTDLEAAGVINGEHFSEDGFTRLQHMEYVNESLFFTVITGTRNDAEDVGWRRGYDRGRSTVVWKDMRTGELRELHAY